VLFEPPSCRAFLQAFTLVENPRLKIDIFLLQQSLIQKVRHRYKHNLKQITQKFFPLNLDLFTISHFPSRVPTTMQILYSKNMKVNQFP
jgi:hypothetical protein